MKEMLSSHLYEINNNKMKMFKRKSFMVFQNSRFFCLNFMLQVMYKQVTQMADYQTSSEATTSSHAQTGLAWPLSNKTQMRTAQEIADDLSVFLNNTYILLRMYY